MKKVLLTIALTAMVFFATGQIKENIVRVETKSTQFLEKYYPKQLIRVADSMPLFALTHATLVGQSMTTVFDSGWYKVVSPVPVLDTVVPYYVVAMRDSSSVLPIKYPVAALLAGANVVQDTTGLDPLCEGLTIYSLADSTMWQHRPIVDTVVGSPTYGDTIGCEWIDMSSNPIVTNPNVVYSNGYTVPLSAIATIKQRTGVQFLRKISAEGTEWIIGADTSKLATQYDLTQITGDYSPWDTTSTAIVQKNVAKKVHVGSTATPDSTFQVTGGAKFTRDVLVNGVTVGRGRETGAHANYDHNLAVGRESLNANTSGNYNTSVGTQSLLSNTTGASNTSVGHQALKSNLGGLSNTAIGAYSLIKNISGNNNTSTGYNSLIENTTGSKNTAIGVESLNKNTTGSNNSTLGHQGLAKNTSGYSNTAVGVSALYSNTTASNLVAVGDSALYSNVTGTKNTAVGSKTLYTINSGVGNTAVGWSALKNTTGNANNAFGVTSLFSNTTGYQNVGIGYSALYSNTTGRQNVAVGVDAMYGNISGTNNVAIGNGAGMRKNDGSANSTKSEKSVYIGASTSTDGDLDSNTVVIGFGAKSKGKNTTTIGNTSTTDTYLAGALTVDSIPNDAAPDSVVTTKNGKLYRALMSSGYDSTANPWKYSSGSTIQRGGGFVGVNTTNPLSRFHTVGAIKGDSLITPTIIGGSAADSKITMQTTTGSGTASAIAWQVSSGANPRITMLHDGKIGFGTTAPGYPLDVVGNSNISDSLVFLRDTSIIYRPVTKGVNNFYNSLVFGNGGRSMSNTTSKTGGQNMFIGMGAGLANTTGWANTYNGSNAGMKNTTGLFNTVVGADAFHENISGSYNTALGTDALFNNIAAINNVAVGYNALYSHKSNNDNVAIGTYALNSDTNGFKNTVIGGRASYNSLLGYQNVSVGYESMQTNIAGYNNVAVGTYAAYKGTSNYNTSVGYSAMYNGTGAHNTAIGQSALKSLTSGEYNVGIGSNSAYYVTGTNNVFVGATSGFTGQVAAVNNSIALGANVFTTASNQAMYGDANMTKHIFQAGNLGIGTTAPTAKLHVAGAARITDTVYNPIHVGGTDVSSSLTLQSTSGAGSSDYIAFKTGSGTEKMRVTTDGKVGIGTSAPSYTLQVGGSGINSEYYYLGGWAILGGSGTMATIGGNSGWTKIVFPYGNIGIGTTAPSARLHLKDGAIRAGVTAYTQIDSSQVETQVVKYTAIPAANSTVSGDILTLTAGEDLTIGDVVFINSSGKAIRCKADAIANCPYAMAIVADASVANNNAGRFLTRGTIRYDTWNWTTVGGLMYVTITGTSGNTLSQAAPIASNNVIMPVGVALSADVIYFTGNLNSVEKQ